MLPSEHPVGCVNVASVDADASESFTFTQNADRLRISTATGGRIRIRVDGTTPATSQSGVQDSIYAVLVDGEEKVIDTRNLFTVVKITALDALTVLQVSATRRHFGQSIG